MKNRTHLFLLIGFVGACPNWAEPLTPAEISIQKAERQIAQRPDHVPYYNGLAMAYARRARETSDVAYYAKAEETLKRGFELASDNFEGLKVKTWLLLGRHEFARALESATALNKRNPDDITVYGYLADANAELGNYKAAVAAAQWMLNLRPGNIAGLTRAAYLRELHGDIAGAIDLMLMAYDATAYQEAEDRAWLLTQVAHLNFVNGDLEKSEKYARGALEIFPNYHYALGALAEVRLQQNRNDEAAELFQRRYAAAPHAENLFSLAEALERSGRHEKAAKAFKEFEEKSLLESRIADNSNHELIAYYLDYAKKPADALKLAEAELTRRHDVYTLACYAWSLAANGETARAEVEMKKVLAVGVRDPKILRRAQMIAAMRAGARGADGRNGNSF